MYILSICSVSVDKIKFGLTSKDGPVAKFIVLYKVDPMPLSTLSPRQEQECGPQVSTVLSTRPRFKLTTLVVIY
jgi:hypothetical protein